jgi:hypothetical protein
MIDYLSSNDKPRCDPVLTDSDERFVRMAIDQAKIAEENGVQAQTFMN